MGAWEWAELIKADPTMEQLNAPAWFYRTMMH
jgi:hypothetical protein